MAKYQENIKCIIYYLDFDFVILFNTKIVQNILANKIKSITNSLSKNNTMLITTISKLHSYIRLEVRQQAPEANNY